MYRERERKGTLYLESLDSLKYRQQAIFWEFYTNRYNFDGDFQATNPVFNYWILQMTVFIGHFHYKHHPVLATALLFELLWTFYLFFRNMAEMNTATLLVNHFYAAFSINYSYTFSFKCIVKYHVEWII